MVFYFVGSGSTGAGLQIQGGAQVEFRAPASGDFAGLVFVQDRFSDPGSTSRIAGGARIKMEGTLYMPTWMVEVTGNGAMFDEAGMWSLIADRFVISGTGDIIVRADPLAVGLPDNVPWGRTWLAKLVR